MKQKTLGDNDLDPPSAAKVVDLAKRQRQRSGIRCEVTETFAVVGFSRDDRGHIDAIYLGRLIADGFRYAGTVKTASTPTISPGSSMSFHRQGYRVRRWSRYRRARAAPSGRDLHSWSRSPIPTRPITAVCGIPL